MVGSAGAAEATGTLKAAEAVAVKEEGFSDCDDDGDGDDGDYGEDGEDGEDSSDGVSGAGGWHGRRGGAAPRRGRPVAFRVDLPEQLRRRLRAVAGAARLWDAVAAHTGVFCASSPSWRSAGGAWACWRRRWRFWSYWRWG